MMTTGELQRQKFDMMARQQEALLKSTEKRLDDMRLMLEEKLQKTLNERIGQSFEIVRSQFSGSHHILVQNILELLHILVQRLRHFHAKFPDAAVQFFPVFLHLLAQGYL